MKFRWEDIIISSQGCQWGPNSPVYYDYSTVDPTRVKWITSEYILVAADVSKSLWSLLKLNYTAEPATLTQTQSFYLYSDIWEIHDYAFGDVIGNPHANSLLFTRVKQNGAVQNEQIVVTRWLGTSFTSSLVNPLYCRDYGSPFYAFTSGVTICNGYLVFTEEFYQDSVVKKSLNTFKIKSSLLTAGEIAALPAYTSGVYYYIGDLVNIGGTPYQIKFSHLSATSSYLNVFHFNIDVNKYVWTRVDRVTSVYTSSVTNQVKTKISVLDNDFIVSEWALHFTNAADGSVAIGTIDGDGLISVVEVANLNQINAGSTNDLNGDVLWHGEGKFFVLVPYSGWDSTATNSLWLCKYEVGTGASVVQTLNGGSGDLGTDYADATSTTCGAWFGNYLTLGGGNTTETLRTLLLDTTAETLTVVETGQASTPGDDIYFVETDTDPSNHEYIVLAQHNSLSKVAVFKVC